MSFAVARLLPVYRGIAIEDYIDLFMRPVWWHSNRATSGTIATNRMYKGGEGAELLTDGGVENWSSGTNLTSWTEALLGSSTVNRESSVVYAGTYSCRYDIDSSSSAASIIQAVSTAIGDTYRLSCRSRSNPSARAMRLDLGSVVGSQQILTDAWAYYEALAIATAASLNFIPQRGNTGASYSLYWDDLSVRKIGEVDGQLAGGVTLGQTGRLGANHAFNLDGSTGLATITQRAAINGLTNFGLWFLVRPDVVGANDHLCLKTDELIVYLNSNGSVFAQVDYGTTDAQTTSSAGVVTAGNWHAVGISINSANRQIRINVDGVEVANTVQAGAGTRVSNTNNLLLYKDTGSNGFDGLADEAFQTNREITEDEFAYLATLAGVA